MKEDLVFSTACLLFDPQLHVIFFCDCSYTTQRLAWV